MIFLAFLFPLAIYLIVLGFINRRRHPLLVSGSWDFLGVLFAASGFLLFGGPAILSSLHERWRLAWIFGQSAGQFRDSDGTWSLWVLLSLGYFLVVLGVSVVMVWRQRRLTAIYNAEPSAVEQTLVEVCERLGLRPVRSGNLFLFDPAVMGAKPAHAPGSTEIQLHPNPSRENTQEALTPSSHELMKRAGFHQSTVLGVDPYPFMHHVTLRWDPAGSPLRPVIEQELDAQLANTVTPEHELGGWFTIVGLGLFTFSSVGCSTLLVLRLFFR